jgi:hypothetical protein
MPLHSGYCCTRSSCSCCCRCLIASAHPQSQVQAPIRTLCTLRMPCRRREVLDMLEAAGFSKSNPYYVVKQGKVRSAFCCQCCIAC